MAISPSSSSRSSRASSIDSNHSGSGSDRSVSVASTHVSTVASTLPSIREPEFASLNGKKWQAIRNGVIGFGIITAITAVALFAIAHSEYCLITTGGLLILAGTLTLHLNEQKKKHWKRIGWGLIGLGVVAGICALWIQVMLPTCIHPSLERAGFVLAGVGLLTPFVALLAHKQKKWWTEGLRDEAIDLYVESKGTETPLTENQALSQALTAHEIKSRSKLFKFTVIPAAILIILGIGFQLMVNKTGWNFTDMQAKSLQDTACNLWLTAIPLAIISGVALYLKKWWEKKGEEHYLNLLDPARTVVAPGMQIKITKNGNLKLALHLELFTHLKTLTNGMKLGETKNISYAVTDNGAFNSLKGEKQNLTIAYHTDGTVTVKSVGKEITVNLKKLHDGECEQTVQESLKAILIGNDPA